MSRSPYSGQGLDDGALAIVHVSQCANVNLGLHPNVTTPLFSFRANSLSWKLLHYPAELNMNVLSMPKPAREPILARLEVRDLRHQSK